MQQEVRSFVLFAAKASLAAPPSKILISLPVLHDTAIQIIFSGMQMKAVVKGLDGKIVGRAVQLVFPNFSSQKGKAMKPTIQAVKRPSWTTRCVFEGEDRKFDVNACYA